MAFSSHLRKSKLLVDCIPWPPHTITFILSSAVDAPAKDILPKESRQSKYWL